MARRLILGATYLLLVVIVGLSVPFALTLGERLSQQLGERVEREAFAAASALEDFLESNQQDALQPAVEDLAQQIGGRVLVTDPQGTLVADSLQPPGPRPPDYGSRQEIATALEGRPTWSTRHSDTLDQDLLVSAVPVRSGDRILGVVRISYPMTEVTTRVRRAYWFLGIVGAIALLVGVALAAWLSRWVTRPLRSAAIVARRIGGGDLDARVPVDGPPEVRDLASSLNWMTEELDHLVRANRGFAANASHQLRTPLTALRLSLENAAAGGNPERDLRAALEQAERLERTVDALLTLGVAPMRPSGRVDVRRAVDEVLATRSTEDVAVEVDGSGSARADDTRIREVLANVIDNACRHAHTLVRIEIADSEGRVHVRIHDDGPGIPEEERPQVFDRFFRGRHVRGSGTGLGLAVARDLLRADGGEIRTSRSSLGGACFEVTYEALAASSSSGVENLNPTPRTVRM